MTWFLIFAGIGLIGLVMVASYAVWLWHKAGDLFSELGMLARRAEELGDLMSLVGAEARDSATAK
ncbi:MAG: hypothetical protein Q3997_05215 [Propionibacteriaceae bacterium]|nr:hypothetical protein [Propionibacteriaceae bacterium]